MNLSAKQIEGVLAEHEGAFNVEVEKHYYDKTRQCCSCGFCVYSPEHAAIMAYREISRLVAAQLAAELEQETIPHDHPPSMGFISSCLGCKAALTGDAGKEQAK